MSRLITAAVVGALVSAGIALAAPAQAAPPAPAGNWQNGTVTCSNGVVSVFPILITNTTNVSRTGSYTVPGAVSNEVQMNLGSPSNANCNYNQGGVVTYSQNFTAAPGETIAIWVGVGATDQANSGSHNIALGGLPNNTPGQSWYDLGLTLNNTTLPGITGGSSFNNITITYQNTGGLDPKTNGQDLFNIVQCDSTANGVYPSAKVLTPYNDGRWSWGPKYEANQAICAAWMPEGTFVSHTNTGALSGVSIAAAQTYASSQYLTQGSANNNLIINDAVGGVAPTASAPTMLAVAGTSTVPVTSVSVDWGNGTAAQTIPLGAAWKSVLPAGEFVGNDSAFYGQDPVTGDWSIANLTPPTGGSNTATISVNGVVVGTATM